MAKESEDSKKIQSFRFKRAIVARLEKEASRRGVSKTDLAEAALEAYFGTEMGGTPPISSLAKQVAAYLKEEEATRKRSKD